MRLFGMEIRTGFVMRLFGMKIKYLPPASDSRMGKSPLALSAGMHTALWVYALAFLLLCDKEPSSIPQPNVHGHSHHTARLPPAK